MAEGENDSGSTNQSKSSASHSGSGLSHRLGPLPVWAWGAVIIGAILMYKFLHRSAPATTPAGGAVGAANNANSLFGSEGFSTNSAGEVIDNATGNILGTFGGATGTGAGSNNAGFAGWVSNAQQALFNLGYDNTLVNKALQDYSSGQQLPPNEYAVIESAIKIVGNPPTGISLPQLQPPPAPPPPAAAPPPAPAPAPPPAPAAPASNNGVPLSQGLLALMAGNGEHIIDSAYNSASNTMLYLTNKGGVYTVGNGFFGSVFNLGGEFVGAPSHITTGDYGGQGYTIYNNYGQSYHFGPPASGADYATAQNGQGAF